MEGGGVNVGHLLSPPSHFMLATGLRRQFLFVIQMYQQLKQKNSMLPMSLSNCLVYFLEKGDTMYDVN